MLSAPTCPEDASAFHGIPCAWEKLMPVLEDCSGTSHDILPFVMSSSSCGRFSESVRRSSIENQRKKTALGRREPKHDAINAASHHFRMDWSCASKWESVVTKKGTRAHGHLLISRQHGHIAWQVRLDLGSCAGSESVPDLWKLAGWWRRSPMTKHLQALQRKGHIPQLLLLHAIIAERR